MNASSANPVRLIFVYNADSGLLNLLADVAHRAVSPSTYPCRLCAVTYSITGMKREWRRFLEKLGVPFTFLHRDELKKRYGIDGVTLPAALVEQNGEARLWIEAEAIGACRSLDDLKRLVAERVRTLSG